MFIGLGKIVLLSGAAIVLWLLLLPASTFGQDSVVSEDSSKLGLKEQQIRAIASLENLTSEFSVRLGEDRIEDLPMHVRTVCSALLILWDYQPDSSKRRLIDLVRLLIRTYSLKFVQQKEARPYFEQSIRYAIVKIASLDRQQANRLLNEYLSAREELKGYMNDDEKLDLAEDYLEIDLAQSVRIAESVLQFRFPKRSISYLSRLKQISPDVHRSLFLSILRVVSSGVHYSVRSELTLQSYVFKERYTVFPVVERSDVPGFNVHEFPASGVEINDISILRDQIVQNDEVVPYLLSCVSGLNVRKLQPNNRYSVSEIYFLVSKLLVYLELHSGATSHLLSQSRSLNSEVSSLALGNGIQPENLEHLKFIATSVVMGYFANAVMDIAEDSASESGDEETKARLLERQILRAISQFRFHDAEKLIFEVKDSPTSEALKDYLNYSILKDAQRKELSHDEIELRLRRISDPNVKVITIFEIATSLMEAGDSDRAREFLFQARRIIFEKLPNWDKQQMAIGLLLLSVTLENELETSLLTETVASISKRESDSERSKESHIYSLQYRGSSIRLYSRKVVDGGIQYVFDGSDIESSFRRVALVSWGDALNYAEAIDRRYLRDRAVVSVCALVLSKS